MEKAKATLLGNLGKTLHTYFDAAANEPLPQRWVDLVKYLNEKERAQAEAQQQRPAPPSAR